MIVEKGILNLATEMLYAAVSTGEEKILKQQCVLAEDETMSYAIFMEACESVAEDLEKFIPDYVATVYNTLKDAIDAGQLILPDEQEVAKAKKNVNKQINKVKKETKMEEGLTKEKQKTSNTKSRSYVVASIIKSLDTTSNFDLNNVAKLANDEYVKSGGRDNINESLIVTKQVVTVLQGYGVML